MRAFKLVYGILTRSERVQCFHLLVLILIMTGFDILGVASIMPFLAVLANPQIIENNIYLSDVFHFFDFESQQNFLLSLGLVMFALLVLSLFVKAYGTYVQIRFAMFREYRISKTLMAGYLKQPYSWFLERHSSDLTKTVLSEVSVLVSGGILPCVTIIAQGVASAGLLGFLIFLDPKLALIVAFSLSLAYLAIFELVKPFLKEYGENRFLVNKKRYLAASDAFGAIKEIKIVGVEDVYLRRFSSQQKYMLE